MYVGSFFITLIFAANNWDTCVWGCDLLSMLAVFSVVISISGSVKYSEATHLPFSGPERRRERENENDDE